MNADATSSLDHPDDELERNRPGVGRLVERHDLWQAERSGSGCFVSVHFDFGGRLADVDF